MSITAIWERKGHIRIMDKRAGIEGLPERLISDIRFRRVVSNKIKPAERQPRRCKILRWGRKVHHRAHPTCCQFIKRSVIQFSGVRCQCSEHVWLLVVGRVKSVGPSLHLPCRRIAILCHHCVEVIINRRCCIHLQCWRMLIILPKRGFHHAHRCLWARRLHWLWRRQTAYRPLGGTVITEVSRVAVVWTIR